MSRIVTGIPFDQEQFARVISRRNPNPSTFLDAKSLESPTVKDFLIEDTEVEEYNSFGTYIKLDI